MTKPYFQGYRRPDGTCGVRNHLLILSVTGLTGPTARRIGRALPGARVVTTPYGSGLYGDDAAVQRRSLIGFGRHPNVGATLVIGGTPPYVEGIAEEIAKSGKPAEALVLDQCEHDSLTLTDRGIRIGSKLARDISRQRRTTAALADLFLAAECGRSDPSSGLVSNPLVGSMIDRLVAAGGRAVFGETLEWLGAEHLLAERAADAATAGAIVAAVARRESQAVGAGIDLLGNNPGPTNIAGGLTTIEEKSLGAISKSGTFPIQGVLGFGEPPPSAGLYAMDAAAYAPESVSGFAAAGAQIVLFTTGPGNSFVNSLAPTIKLSANPVAARRLSEQLDFDASGVFENRETPETAADRLFDLILEVASGTSTFGEILDEGEEVISRMGAAL
jgi:altronate dehydratase large subunit